MLCVGRTELKTGKFALLLALAIGMLPRAAQAADRIEQFFGTWLPPDQRTTCKQVEEWGEGPQLTIKKNYLEWGDAAPCEEVEMTMAAGKLRVGGSCAWEGGYRASAVEFELRGDTMIYRGKRFVRCTP